ncbi:MAG: beta-ketoacyl-ACP synthase II [Planctomycetia bacterium]|nr:beta-ketoacyl-ACP synthase II [Planctomycetia bacterium]
MERRIVITGMGIVSPLGCKVERAWQQLCNGKSCGSMITHFDPALYRSKICAYVDSDFTTEGYLEHKEVKHLDRCEHFGIVAAMDAVRDSGLDFSKVDLTRCASMIGSGIGGLTTFEEQMERLWERGPSKVSPFTIPRMIPNGVAGQVSIIYGMEGPSFCVTSACASASHAISCLIDAIRLGKVDVGVTGGVESTINKVTVSAFSAMHALTERNEDPQRASRPFDKDRDGFLISEGAGILVLEELEHAKRRGAKIYAEVLGYGSTSDAFHIAQPEPEGRGAARAMSEALKDAKLNPEQISYINAHGTSTILGDLAETKAIKLVFGEDAYKINISSTKGHIGHALGASGALELIFCVQTLLHGVIPPTINLENPDPECDLNYTPNVAQQRECRYALSNSFGFGGHNNTLIIGKYE